MYLWILSIQLQKHKAVCFKRKKSDVDTINHQKAHRHNTAKPQWVVDQVVILKAHMPNAGCRTVANTFNRLYKGHATVGKSFVASTIISNQYQIMQARRRIKNTLPAVVATNDTWAMDLSFYTDANRQIHVFMGIVDHGSRLLVSLTTLVNKSSWTLLGHLCLTIGKYGKPNKIRTDNEAIFTSYTFTTLLKLIGIKHQRIRTASPWKNGRIERLFGTLKPLLRQLVINDKPTLQQALTEFRQFYNHIRPHQNLSGKTPAEAWNATNTGKRTKQAILIKALDGLMVGFKIRR